MSSLARVDVTVSGIALGLIEVALLLKFFVLAIEILRVGNHVIAFGSVGI